MFKPFHKLLIFFIFCAFALIFGQRVSVSCAATYYVDQNNFGASDSNPGTELLPWKTLKKATDSVVAGDHVYVKAGRYMDNASTWEHAFNPANSGTATSPVIFESLPRLAAVLVPKDIYSPSFGITGVGLETGTIRKVYITLDGFKSEGMIQALFSSFITIKNCEVINGSLQGVDQSLHWGINIEYTHNSLVKNNYVHNFGSFGLGVNDHNTAGIMVFGDSDYNIIENNYVDAGRAVYNAFGTKGGGMDDNIWRFNIGENCHSGFIGMGNSVNTNYTLRDKVTQNIIKNCDHFIEFDHGAQDWEVFNNVAYNDTDFLFGGYYQDSSSVAPRRTNVWNNIIFHATSAYRREPTDVSWMQLMSYADYNNFFQTTYPVTYNWESSHISQLSQWQSLGFDLHSVITDPLFVDLNKFKPQSESPMNNLGIDRQDYNGNGNTAERINMGAYITGNEIIGLFDVVLADTTPPSPPAGILVS